MIGAVQEQGVLAAGPNPLVGEALGAEVAGQIVVVRPQVDGPALAERVQDERPKIEVAVIGGVVTALKADVDRVLVVPGGAEEGEVRGLVAGVER